MFVLKDETLEWTIRAFRLSNSLRYGCGEDPANAVPERSFTRLPRGGARHEHCACSGERDCQPGCVGGPGCVDRYLSRAHGAGHDLRERSFERARAALVDLPRSRQPGRHDLRGHGVPLLPFHRWHVDASGGDAAAEEKFVAGFALAACAVSLRRPGRARSDPGECGEERCCAHGSQLQCMGAARSCRRSPLLVFARPRATQAGGLSLAALRRLGFAPAHLCALPAHHGRWPRRMDRRLLS